VKYLETIEPKRGVYEHLPRSAEAFPKGSGLFGYRNDRKLMNMTKWIMICLLAVALAPVGCSKKDSQTSGQPQAVTLDVPKLRAAFAAASPELKAQSDDIIRNIEFGRSYSAGLAALEKLAGAPDLTEEQKKVVADVMGQVKQMMGGGAATPAQ
jgi:hypothetical protein